MIVYSYKEAPTSSGLYKIISPTGKVYIGQSVNLQRRLKAYFTLASFLKSQVKVYASLRKYGVNNHIIEVLECCDVALLNKQERYYKELIISEVGWKGALFTRVDDCSSGPMHPDTILKMKTAKIGSKLTQETKQKIASAHRGMKKSYISERNKTMFKGRQALNKRAIVQLDKGGTLICEFASIDEAIRITSVNPKACLSGKCKTAGGFIWKYKDSFVY